LSGKLGLAPAKKPRPERKAPATLPACANIFGANLEQVGSESGGAQAVLPGKSPFSRTSPGINTRIKIGYLYIVFRKYVGYLTSIVTSARPKFSDE
jgi:hypothetical protein